MPRPFGRPLAAGRHRRDRGSLWDRIGLVGDILRSILRTLEFVHIISVEGMLVGFIIPTLGVSVRKAQSGNNIVPVCLGVINTVGLYERRAYRWIGGALH